MPLLWKNETEDIAGLRREFCRSLFHGTSLWWFDMWGKFFTGRETLREIARFKQIWDRLADRNRQPVLLFDGQRRNSIRYNDFGYPEEIRNVFGQSSRFHFDRFNRLERAEDNSGVTTFYTYNATGRVERIERRDGEMTLTSLEIAYDGNGLPVAYIDQAGREKKFERDAFGRIVKELFPDETQVEYTYNPLGRLASVLDQNQNYIRFEWNRFGLDAKTTQEGHRLPVEGENRPFGPLPLRQVRPAGVGLLRRG